MNKTHDLGTISAKAYQLKVLATVVDDIFDPLKKLSFKFERKVPNAALMLAYETNRTLEQLVELNIIMREIAREIEMMVDEIDSE